MKLKTAKRNGILAAAGCAALLVAGLTAHAESAKWLTDFEQAKKQARETERPILVNFSGSDWCGWCIRLDKEVLSQAEFKTYAKDNLVLFNADFPRSTKLPEKEAKQNQKLARQFGVQGFPTVFLVAADGKTAIAKTGYQPGGAKNYVDHIAALITDHEAKNDGKQDAAATTTPKGPKPNEYDAENDRHWNADHGHWHPGRPPAGK